MEKKSTLKKLISKYKSLWKLNKRLPALPYIETHLVDHCNLNCVGCTHYSHMSKEYFVDINKYTKNIKQLSKILRFNRIRLLGGEPLLHPEVNKFMEVTRKYFPRSRLCLVTNGVLLPSMDESFWKTCRDNNIIINLSRYPANSKKIKDYVNLIKKNNVRVGWIHPGEKMYVFHNPKGDSRPVLSFLSCSIRKFRVIILRDSNIYICPKTAYIDIYNEKFNTNVPKDEGKNIFKYRGKEILKYLKKPINTCKFCTYGGKMIPWQTSDSEKTEWDLDPDLDLLIKEQERREKLMIKSILEIKEKIKNNQK